MPKSKAMAHSPKEIPSCDDSSTGGNTASTAASSTAESDHLRSVKDYRTFRELKLALTCGSFLDEQKKRQELNKAPLSLQDHDSASSIPDLQQSSDDSLYDDTEYSDDFSDLEDELSKSLDPEFDWVVQDLDKNSSVDQTLEDELYRLQVLRSYFVLDNKPEVCFDRLTTLGSRLLNVPICIVSLVDLGRIWFVSSFGAGDARQIPRNMTFCAHANLTTQDLLIVNDASKDIRFKNNSLVSQPPYIRFYGGAPLICPEGVKLGTFCVLDTVARPNGLSAEEKHSLRELAEMTVEMMVERRANRREASEDKSKLIACTAHDLLTPLSGVQMSVSLLKEDKRLSVLMDEEHKDILETAENCSQVLAKICHDTIETFRTEHDKDQKDIKKLTKPSSTKKKNNFKMKPGHKVISIEEMVNNISTVMDPYPKNVPLYVTVDPNLPPSFVSNELTVFRSVINYLTNACKHTEEGCIHLKVQLEQESSGRKERCILFEVEDSGSGVPPETYPSLFRPFRGEKKTKTTAQPVRPTCLDAKNGAAVCGPASLEDTPGLGLYSVASNIGGLHGNYGFRPRSMQGAHQNEDGDGGSIFWFSIPFIQDPSTPSTAQPSTEGNDNATNALPMKKSRAGPDGRKASASSSARSRKKLLCKEVPCRSRSKSKKSQKKKSKAETYRVTKRIGGGTWNKKKTQILVDDVDDSDGDDTVDSYETATNEEDSAKVPIVERIKKTKPSKKKKGKISSSVNDGSSEITSMTEKLELMESDVVESTPAKNCQQPKRKPKLLIIDDSLVIRKSIARAFSTMGFDVVHACNGMEGLEKLKAALFDLVLCDFLMPVMDGLDCIQQFREWECEHRPWFRQFVLGISAHANTADMQRGLDVGMNEFRSKPLPLDTIKSLVDSEKVQSATRILDHLAGKAEEELKEFQRANSNSQLARPSPKKEPSFSSSFKMPPPVGLVVAGDSCERILTKAMHGLGWQVVVAQDHGHAVKELKQRNFDAVLVDDSQHGVVNEFRDWENASRITKQRNVVCLCRRFVAPPPGAVAFRSSTKPYPEGFDDILAKPVQSMLLTALLQRVKDERLCETSSKDIMLR